MGGVGSRRRVGEGLGGGGGELGWGRGSVGRRKKVARKETRWIRSKGFDLGRPPRIIRCKIRVRMSSNSHG
jgi:hypothetical protein